MGQYLAQLALVAAPTTMSLGACSLIYNPNNLPGTIDAMPDSPAARVPCELAIEDVTPSVIAEGAGAGGSRPAVIVIRGKNLVKDGTTVVVAAAGASRVLSIMTDNPSLDADISGELLAVPVSLGVDPALPGTEMVPLKITVKQTACLEGAIEKELVGKLSLKGLDELVDPTPAVPTISLPAGVREYSQINVQTATLTAAANQTGPIILRSMSSVSIAKPISVSAPAIAGGLSPGGPGGGSGGAGGMGLGGAGSPGTGPSAGQPSGGPGRFDSADVGLSTLDGQNRSSGGAGGDGAVIAGNGGRGGGGGGSIEISAGGNVQVAAISSKGTPGQSGAGLGGADGGGGSGGVILLRAGGTLTAGDLDVHGGGTGHDGRARYDAAGTATVSSGALGADHYRGPMIVAASLITKTATPELTVVGKPLSEFRYFFINDSGGDVKGPFDATIAASGTVRITTQEMLYRGSNLLCAVVKGASSTSSTRNCVDIAYLQP